MPFYIYRINACVMYSCDSEATSSTALLQISEEPSCFQELSNIFNILKSDFDSHSDLSFVIK